MCFLIKNNPSFPPKNKKTIQAQMVPGGKSTKHSTKQHRRLHTNPVRLQEGRGKLLGWFYVASVTPSPKPARAS